MSLCHLSGLEKIGDDRADRINANDLYFGILLLEITPYAGNRAACAHAANEGIYSPCGLPPDLRASELIMCQWVNRIVILVRQD